MVKSTKDNSNISSDSTVQPKAGEEFDPAKLRLSQDYIAMVGVKKHIATVPVRKSGNEEFIRTHPDDEYWLETMVMDSKSAGEIYLVDPALRDELSNYLRPVVLIPTITRQKVLILWPAKLSLPDGKLNLWNASALEAARRAQQEWVRISSNNDLGAYEVSTPVAQFPDPEWPELTLHQILEIAFKGRYINSLDHILLQRLRGEI